MTSVDCIFLECSSMYFNVFVTKKKKISEIIYLSMRCHLWSVFTSLSNLFVGCANIAAK